MRAPLKVTVAATAVVASLLIYAGHARARDGSAPAASTAAAPDKTSFAKIGIGACADSNDEPAAVATTPSADSCSAPIGHASDVASLSVDQTRSASEASSYSW